MSVYKQIVNGSGVVIISYLKSPIRKWFIVFFIWNFFSPGPTIQGPEIGDNISVMLPMWSVLVLSSSNTISTPRKRLRETKNRRNHLLKTDSWGTLSFRYIDQTRFLKFVYNL